MMQRMSNKHISLANEQQNMAMTVSFLYTLVQQKHSENDGFHKKDESLSDYVLFTIMFTFARVQYSYETFP